jgi:putative transposase
MKNARFEESAGICGYDAHKHVKGRKRHLLVATLGIPLSIFVTPGDMHDTRVGSVPARRTHILRAPPEENLGRRSLSRAGVSRVVPGTRGFSIQPRRWGVERSFGWLCRNRRLSKDYERKVQTSETLIQVAMIRLLLARLGRKSSSIPEEPERNSDFSDDRFTTVDN